MSERERNIPEKYRHKEVFSFSKLSSFHNCEHEYFLTYISKKPRIDNIYSKIGGFLHFLLEELQQNKIDNNKAIELFNENLLECELTEYKFPSERIKTNFVECITHYLKNYKPIECDKYEIEKEFVTLVGNTETLILGYIDLVIFNPDGSVNIFDYKSSTEYSKADFLKHARQLLVYAYALAKEYGYKIKKIAFNMLKYVEIEYMGKTKSITKKCLRNKVVDTLKVDIKSELRALNKNEIEIELLVADSISNNSLENLPKSIQEKYTFKDYYLECDFIPETVRELQQHVDDTIHKIASKNALNGSEWLPVDIDNNSFYCATLCSQRGNCVYYKEYCDKNADNFKPKEDKNDLIKSLFYS